MLGRLSASSSMAEQRTLNPQVLGSNPRGRTLAFLALVTMENVDWLTFAQSEPHFSAMISARFKANEHHVLATLRRDGSPRLSGTNVYFSEHLRIGMMAESRRVSDLRHDPRCAVHSATLDPELREGDAKLDCLAHEIGRDEAKKWLQSLGRPSETALAFEMRIARATLTQVDGDSLRIQTWDPKNGLIVLNRN
jgi:hypothetical protein